MLPMTIHRREAAAVWRTRALEFMNGLPQNEEGPERATAFRALPAAATESAFALRLLCAVYELAADTDVISHSVHDAHMFVSSVTERLELLPILEGYIERFLARRIAHDSPLRGLWLYVRELDRLGYELHVSMPVRAGGVRAEESAHVSPF
jgi:hypothetical protein